MCVQSAPNPRRQHFSRQVRRAPWYRIHPVDAPLVNLLTFFVEHSQCLRLLKEMVLNFAHCLSNVIGEHLIVFVSTSINPV